jgi:hypothetical protein
LRTENRLSVKVPAPRMGSGNVGGPGELTGVGLLGWLSGRYFFSLLSSKTSWK